MKNQHHSEHKTNQKVYLDMYKTKLCPLFSTSTCYKGTNCTYAHSESELREKPNLVKTKICENYSNGSCLNGESCTFAHGEYDLRSTSNFYKTAICINWQYGKCASGEKCRFAHGAEELRSTGQKMQKKFQKKPYGSRPYNNDSSMNMDSGSKYNNNYSYPPFGSPMMVPYNFSPNTGYGYKGGNFGYPMHQNIYPMGPNNSMMYMYGNNNMGNTGSLSSTTPVMGSGGPQSSNQGGANKKKNNDL